MTAPTEPAELFAEAEALARTDGLSLWVATMRVLVVRLERVRSELAEPAREALAAARAVWFDGTAAPATLVDQKVLLWQHLEERNEELSWSWVGRSTRCVLGVLEPGGDEEARSDTVEWFCVFLYRYGATVR